MSRRGRAGPTIVAVFRDVKALNSVVTE